MRNRHTKTVCFLIIAALLIVLSQAVGAKGKPTKVEVTAANPSVAAQGEEKDIYISGAGFGHGSTVKYLVTGTTDDTQIDVLSTEYIESTGELKTRVKVKDAAIVIDYDIEVQAASGRKGKGTTLFKVQQAEVACTGFESKEPEIAYLTAFDISEDIHTQDIYLSSASGCDHYLLLENAVEKLPRHPKDGGDVYYKTATGLRLDVEGTIGVVSWRETSVDPSPQMGLTFVFDAFDNVSVTSGPRTFYSSGTGADIRGGDVRINDQGHIELVLVERTADQSEQFISIFNHDTGDYSILSAGTCHVQDDQETCYNPYGRINWNETGTGIFFEPIDPIDGRHAIAKLQQVSDVWGQAEIFMTHHRYMGIIGISSAGFVAYEYEEVETNKNGKVLNRIWSAGTIYANECELSDCVPYDGVQLAVDVFKYPRGWTRSGGLLFIETGPGAQRNIREYSNPYTGEIGTLDIRNVDRYQYHRDSTF